MLAHDFKAPAAASRPQFFQVEDLPPIPDSRAEPASEALADNAAPAVPQAADAGHPLRRRLAIGPRAPWWRRILERAGL